MKSGTGIYELQGKRYKCSKGDTFVIFPGELFSYEADADSPWHYVWAAFGGHLVGAMLQQLGVTPERPVIRCAAPRKTFALYRKLLQSMRQTDWPPLADLESAGLLRLLFHELGLSNLAHLPFRPTFATAAERQVNQAVRWLSLQYAQPVSIEQLAQSLGYHRTHLTKIFKKQIGVSPMQFLMNIRLEQAKSLLDSHWTIEQVASSVGFSDALYFSKQFRKRYGVSPSEYRRRDELE
ncbi:AraC family transcriptional regulator [Paenibacillus sp. TRM 82003]|nr:AraC family transcriptional regulator [Paenibacillus sp. TRM 82003]